MDILLYSLIPPFSRREKEKSSLALRERVGVSAKGGHGRVHQGLVVAVFVALGKLQIAIEKQLVPRAPVGHHNTLVGRGGRQHDGLVVELVFC